MTREERMDKATADMCDANARRLSAIAELDAANTAYSKAVEDYNAADADADAKEQRITIMVETGNAAFEESATAEIARILFDLAGELILSDSYPKILRDGNGNVCGTVTMEAI